jgi:hypothetical protein
MEKVKLSATDDMTGPGIPRMVITVFFTQDKKHCPISPPKDPQKPDPKTPKQFSTTKNDPQKAFTPQNPLSPTKEPPKARKSELNSPVELARGTE